LAEYANGRISIGRIRIKWTSSRARSFQSTWSEFGQFHRFFFLQEKSSVLHEFKLFYIFLEILAEFAVFGLLSHSAGFFRPFFPRPFELRSLAYLPKLYRNQ
jgi:hypothetical protein